MTTTVAVVNFCSGLEDTKIGPFTRERLRDNTTRFLFVDGTNEGIDFFEDPSVSPWDDDQPGDNGEDDDCVRYQQNLLLLLLYLTCFDE